LASVPLSVEFVAFEAFTTLRITEQRVHIERAGSAYVHSCLGICVCRTRHANVITVVSVRASSACRTCSRSRLGNLKEKNERKNGIKEGGK
jgi:hypothetical protein